MDTHDHAQRRKTTGIVDRVEENGVVFLHESSSNKRGFLANTTPIVGSVQVRPGTRLTIEVEDRGNVMVVTSARILADH